jgi:hypothetical protein
MRYGEKDGLWLGLTLWVGDCEHVPTMSTVDPALQQAQGPVQSLVVRPGVSPYVPAGQGMGLPTPAGQYEPAGLVKQLGGQGKRYSSKGKRLTSGTHLPNSNRCVVGPGRAEESSGAWATAAARKQTGCGAELPTRARQRISLAVGTVRANWARSEIECPLAAEQWGSDV